MTGRRLFILGNSFSKPIPLNPFPFLYIPQFSRFTLLVYLTLSQQLQNLDLVTIRSLTPRNQLLKPLSWQVAGGLERVPGEDGDENLVSHLNGGAGGSWMFGDDLLLYAMGTARIENNRDFAAAIAPAVGFDSGLLWRNPLGNLTLEAKGDYFHNGEVRRSLGFVQQVELGRDLGLRLSAEREFSHVGKPINEVKLELRWYYY